MTNLAHFLYVVKMLFSSPNATPPLSRSILVNVNGQTHILQVTK